MENVMIEIENIEIRQEVLRGMLSKGFTEFDTRETGECRNVTVYEDDTISILPYPTCAPYTLYTITSRYDWLYLILTS